MDFTFLFVATLVGVLCAALGYWAATKKGQGYQGRNKARQLTAAKDDLEYFFELSPDFLCVVHIDGTFKSVNATFVKKLGYELSALVGQRAFDFIHPEDITATQAALATLREGKSVNQFVNRYRTAQGDYLSLQWRATPHLLTGEIYATAEDVTDSHRVYNELKRLSRIAQEIPSVAVITDADGLVTWVNPAFERVTGYSLQEVLGKKPGSFLQGELTNEETISEIREAIRLVKPFEVEILNYNKNGNAYWVAIECQPLFNDAGEHEGFLSVQSDISERVRVASALEHRQKLLEQMSVLGNIGAWEYDLETQAVYWSDVMRNIHGVAPDFVPTAENFLAFLPDEASRRLIESLAQKTIKTGETWQQELEIVRPSGERRWVLVLCRAEFVRRRCKKLHGAYQDIHERKINQIANMKLLAHSQALAKLTLDRHVLKGDFELAAVEVAKTCALALNADRVSIWLFNDDLSAMRLTVLNDRGEIDTTSGTVLKREDYPKYFKYVFQHTFVNASHARSHPATEEMRDNYLNPLGIYSMLDATIAGGGHFAGLICIEQYATARVWNTGEEAFISALATLLSSVYDRQQRKITERALKNAVKKANSAAQAKSNFLASMSHEIRTPMNGVLGMLGLILKTPLNGDQERKVRIALNSAQSLLTIINDILDFSKIDAGKLVLEETGFDLISLFSEFAETMAFRAQEHQLELLTNLREMTANHVVGDPGRLRQILTNLVGNALKFTHHGEVLISAKTHEDGEDVVLECSVADTGIGIPKDKQADLFEQFTQVDASNTRQYGGTGLGLSIVKRLSEAMGGSVTVDSDEGQGSCFTFTVRFKKNLAPELKLPDIDLTGRRVLVVDDNRTNQLIIAEQLAAWGCEVTIADNAGAAMQLCEQTYDANGYFDIALLDMQMPGADGATLGKMLKADKRFAPIPLVMMTSQAQRGDAAEFGRIGFSGYFPKPVNPKTLLEAIMVILDGKTLPYAIPLVTRHFLGALEPRLESHPPIRYSLRGQPRILLVEDNRINQEVALDLLIDMGLSADVAADGQEALHALAHAPAAHPYELVLMDCQMPGMDGFAATEAIRRGDAGEINRDIPIIALTANAMLGDKEQCLNAGMNDYLSKPIDPDHLQELLARWLEGDDETEGPSEPKSAQSPAPGEQVLDEASPPAESRAPLWDKASALQRVRGRRERLKVLIQRYLDQSPELISDIFQAVEVQNFTRAEQLCHSLRGVAANLGGLALADTTQVLETACQGSNAALARQRAGELLVINDHFVNAIREFDVL